MSKVNKTIYILCNKDGEHVYRAVSKSMLRTSKFYANIITVQFGELENFAFPPFNNDNVELGYDNTISVLQLGKLSSDIIDSFISQFENGCSLEKYFGSFISSNLLLSNNMMAESLFSRMSVLLSCKEFMFWHKKLNIPDLTEKFLHRQFPGYDAEILKTTIDKFKKSRDFDYDFCTINYDNINSETDEFAFFKKYSFSDTLSIEKFNSIFNIIKDNHKDLKIFSKIILLMPKYIHLALHNKKFLNILFFNNPFRKQEISISSLLRYCYVSKVSKYISYALAYLYIEELKTVKVSDDDRFIFDISLVSEYGIIFDEFNHMISPKIKTFAVNLFPPLESDVYKCVNIVEFRNRLNIFITGNFAVNIFKGLDWNNMCVTGSVMACCLPRDNCFTDFSTHGYTHQRFSNFCKSHYEDSDIDIPINGTLEEFMDTVYKFREIVTKNIRENIIFLRGNVANKNLDFEDEFIEYETVKTTKSKKTKIIAPPTKKIIKNKSLLNSKDDIVRIHLDKMINARITENFIRTNLINYKDVQEEEIESIVSNYINVLDRINKYNPDEETDLEMLNTYNNIRSKIYLIYLKSQHEILDKYPETRKICTENQLRVFFERDLPENIKILPVYKYTIKSPYLLRDFELFRNRHQNFMSMVKNFHLPCVRALYDGNTVKMTLSCAVAVTTFTNIGINFYAGIRNYISICAKYHKRGYGIMLSPLEVMAFIKECACKEQYSTMYPGIDFKKKEDVLKLLSGQSKSSQIYPNVASSNSVGNSIPRPNPPPNGAPGPFQMPGMPGMPGVEYREVNMQDLGIARGPNGGTRIIYSYLNHSTGLFRGQFSRLNHIQIENIFDENEVRKTLQLDMSLLHQSNFNKFYDAIINGDKLNIECLETKK